MFYKITVQNFYFLLKVIHVIFIIGNKPALPDIPLGEEYKPVIELFDKCTEKDFSNRPSAREIIEFLDSVKIEKSA